MSNNFQFIQKRKDIVSRTATRDSQYSQSQPKQNPTKQGIIPNAYNQHSSNYYNNSNQLEPKDKPVRQNMNTATMNYYKQIENSQTNPQNSIKRESKFPQIKPNPNNGPQQHKINVNNFNHCDFIQLKDSDQYLVLFQFTVYFGQFSIDRCSLDGDGLILQRYFDKDFNSSYFHYKGHFKGDNIIESGQLFINKSKTICQEGRWSSISKTLNRTPQIAIKCRQKIKIPTQSSREFNFDISNLFHDQLLNQRDIDILKRTSWLNNGIIDAYIEHLNYEDEINYWKLNSLERKYWFHKGKDKQNLYYFKQVFTQFEPIQYRIWEIYKKIGFVINSSNVHWYFVQLDFETMEIIIKDSMRGLAYYYNTTVDILQNLFQQIDENISFTVKVGLECQQQRNSYDCGAYTCINALNLAEGTVGNKINGAEMRSLLLNLIKFKF